MTKQQLSSAQMFTARRDVCAPCAVAAEARWGWWGPPEGNGLRVSQEGHPTRGDRNVPAVYLRPLSGGNVSLEIRNHRLSSHRCGVRIHTTHVTREKASQVVGEGRWSQAPGSEGYQLWRKTPEVQSAELRLRRRSQTHTWSQEHATREVIMTVARRKETETERPARRQKNIYVCIYIYNYFNSFCKNGFKIV